MCCIPRAGLSFFFFCEKEFSVRLSNGKFAQKKTFLAHKNRARFAEERKKHARIHGPRRRDGSLPFDQNVVVFPASEASARFEVGLFGESKDQGGWAPLSIQVTH